MSEEKKNAAAEKILTAAELAKGTLKLKKPIRAASTDVTELKYDFDNLTGWEYAEAMDADPNARTVFKVTARQAMSLFAMSAAKENEKIDATDIREQMGVADTMKAVQLTTLFLAVSAKAEKENTSADAQK